jgi:hypothetical protein
MGRPSRFSPDLPRAADRPVDVAPASPAAARPTRRPARAQRDDKLRVANQRVWDANH